MAAPHLVATGGFLDDTGFAQLGCYGSDIDTPNVDALAANGLGDQHTLAGNTGGMKLEELHVFQGETLSCQYGRSVSCVCVCV